MLSGNKCSQYAKEVQFSNLFHFFVVGFLVCLFYFLFIVYLVGCLFFGRKRYDLNCSLFFTNTIRQH